MNALVAVPGGWELVLIVLVILLLFGAKKLPELARGSGRALRIFKSETKGLKDDDEPEPPTTAESRGELPASSADEEPTTPDRQTDTHNG